MSLFLSRSSFVATRFEIDDNVAIIRFDLCFDIKEQFQDIQMGLAVTR